MRCQLYEVAVGTDKAVEAVVQVSARPLVADIVDDGAVVFAVTVVVPVAVQPLVPVTVTVYVPAVVTVTLWVVPKDTALRCHAYTNAAGTDNTVLDTEQVRANPFVLLMVETGGVVF